MQPEVKSMNFLEWLMFIILAILWGGSFFFVGVVVNVLPPLTIVSLRVSLASAETRGLDRIFSNEPFA